MLYTTSLVVAFISGVIALFAPCCISFMLPSYLGNILQQRFKVVIGTLFFAAGIATVMLPVALGFRLLVNVFNEYHTQTYVIAGLIMIATGILFLKQFKLPMMKVKTDMRKVTYGSLYTLGISSGLASSCCAPVLMAALTLTAISPTTFQAFLVGIAYVMGIVAPLFLGAIFIKSNYLGKVRAWLGKKIGPYHVGDLIGAVMMIGFGIAVIYLALTGQVIMPEQGQVFGQKVSLFAAQLNKVFSRSKIYDIATIGVVMVIIAWLVRAAQAELKQENTDENESSSPTKLGASQSDEPEKKHSCH
ncbi:MAG: Cytochrome c biogenesis protein transmembrane region [Parcubacteria group bacterium GW2011_GWC1_41_7]|nr:MAG: Cytochrome c biogenesis protein transmembrane region [Parcubacteria group bacterium GW2011_GWC1_41_7]